MLKVKSLFLLALLCPGFMISYAENETQITASDTTFSLIPASHPQIYYTGRIDKSDSQVYRFSAPGAYITAKFTGTSCQFDMGAEWNQNYIEVVVDNNAPQRILITSARKTYLAASGLPDGVHTLLICKDTESGMGSLHFYGLRCKQLVDYKQPVRKIECYGNSITCGAKMITGPLCEQTENWNAPNKAYVSYGALTARALNARYHLTSVSGIGLVKSCCDMTVTMPTTYDKTFLEKADSKKWDFSQYVPDVVTICLGQNDGAEVVRSTEFKNAYIAFVKDLHAKYPLAHFFLLTSPMADDQLLNAMTQSIDTVIENLNTQGIYNIHKVVLPHKLNNGCQYHPNETEHQQVAQVLTQAVKDIMGW
jgi:lysophospholipase L1-like esterase